MVSWNTALQRNRYSKYNPVVQEALPSESKPTPLIELS